jgi:hypothetical protein
MCAGGGQGPAVNTQYDASYGSPYQVDWRSVRWCIPTMVLFWIVITVDIIIKVRARPRPRRTHLPRLPRARQLAAVRKGLNAHHMDFDHEVMLAGKTNILSGFLVGSPAYNQPYLTMVRGCGVLALTLTRRQ